MSEGQTVAGSGVSHSWYGRALEASQGAAATHRPGSSLAPGCSQQVRQREQLRGTKGPAQAAHEVAAAAIAGMNARAPLRRPHANCTAVT